MDTSRILITHPGPDYELLDSGEGEKLERYGSFTLSRPDPQALWLKQLPASAWDKADGYFIRGSDRAEWSFRRELPADGWPISFGGLTMLIKPTAFKHTGIFPEQAANWEWMQKRIGERSTKDGVRSTKDSADIEVLNLFGYTGGATLACAQAGAKVVHIDGSKSAVAWARDNAELSGLADKPIRWIVEDARIFVEREIRRGRMYDAIIMDPPAFGHGPSNELWKIEEHFLPLIADCMKLLKPDPLFFVINGYSAGYSAIAYMNDLLPLKEKHGGEIEIGELAIQESAGKGVVGKAGDKKMPARLLPAGIFARWAR